MFVILVKAQSLFHRGYLLSHCLLLPFFFFFLPLLVSNSLLFHCVQSNYSFCCHHLRGLCVPRVWEWPSSGNALSPSTFSLSSFVLTTFFSSSGSLGHWGQTGPSPSHGRDLPTPRLSHRHMPPSAHLQSLSPSNRAGHPASWRKLEVVAGRDDQSPPVSFLPG